VRKNNFLILLTIGMFLAISLAASRAFAEDVESKGNNDYVVASIGEEKIYFSEIEQAVRNRGCQCRGCQENPNISRDQCLSYVRQYVVQAALAKRAERENIHRDKEVIFMIERARERVLSDKVKSNRLDKIKITEEDLEKYYRQNQERYQTKEKIKLSYIKVKNKKQAEKIIAALNKGKSFEKAAKKRAVKLINWISQGVIPSFLPEGLSFQAVNELFFLDIGGSSNPVEVRDEFYIFHIDEKEPAQDQPFAEARRQVENVCIQEARDKAIAELIRETFVRENVEIYEDGVIE